MAELVTIADRIYERQCFKMVEAPEGPRVVPAGELPEPTDDVLMRYGEPTFEVRMADELRTDEDLEDAVGFALRKAAGRFHGVMADGQEVSEGSGPVEWIVGPTVHAGVVVLYLDTDGGGCTRPMIETMANILKEELAATDVPAQVSASPADPVDMGPEWISSAEREQG